MFASLIFLTILTCHSYVQIWRYLFVMLTGLLNICSAEKMLLTVYVQELIKLTNFPCLKYRQLPRSDCLEYGRWNITSFPSSFNNFGHGGTSFSFACQTLKFIIVLVMNMYLLIFCFASGLWQSLFFCHLSTYMYWRWQCHGCTGWGPT